MAVGHLVFLYSSFWSVSVVNAATESCARLANASLVLMSTCSFLQHTFCIPASGPVVTDHSLDLFLVLQCCSICFYSPGCFGSLQSLRPCKDGAQGTIGLSFVSKHS